MHGYLSSRRVMWAILITLLLVGCSAPATQPPSELPPAPEVASPTVEPSPVSTPEPEVVLLEVDFDGDQCTITGPTEFPPGDHLVVFRNQTDNDTTDIGVGLLRDGKTYQDLVDLRTDPEETLRDPRWSSDTSRLDQTWNETLQAEVNTFDFILEGEYYIMVASDNPPASWICGPFYVVAAPSE